LISQVEHAQTMHEYQKTMNQTKRPEIKAILILHLKHCSNMIALLDDN
jgi:hypothetical protein